MDLKGKIIAVTGAGSGIGRQLACALARRGAIPALADISSEMLAETAVMLGNAHHSTAILDVADRAAMENWAHAIADQFGAVHGIINNAGVTFGDSVEAGAYEDFEWLMNINFWGVVYGTKAFLPHLRAAGEGAIVNISSIFGLIGYPQQAAYNASKFAVRGFTEALRHELKDTAISVIQVHPGGIRTHIARHAPYLRNQDGRDVQAELAERFETRMPTSADRAARAIVTGIEKDRQRILIGPDARIVDLVQRLMPLRYFSLLRGILG